MIAALCSASVASAQGQAQEGAADRLRAAFAEGEPRRATSGATPTETAPKAATRPPARPLRRGMRGRGVAALQAALKRRGHNVPTHGRFDAVTELALRNFQRTQGLPQTGEADDTTQTALAGLVRGDEGERVIELQRALNHQRRALGLSEIEVDGTYGSGTEDAVREVQRIVGQEVDGRADRRLIHGLLSAQRRDERPEMGLGTRGQAVTRLQERVNVHRKAAGLPLIDENGVYDQATATALSTFQRGHALDVNGRSNEATWEALYEEPPVDLRATPLKEGDQHREVAVLQDRINLLRRAQRQDPIEVTGTFDAATRQALEAFQRGHDLPVTGRSDAATVAQLEHEIEESGATPLRFPTRTQPSIYDGGTRIYGQDAVYAGPPLYPSPAGEGLRFAREIERDYAARPFSPADLADFPLPEGDLTNLGSGDVVYRGYNVSDPLVRQALERLSALTGKRVILTSGDRNHVPRGGSRTSLHL
ncbi:MAG TPA: hypothetical protein DEA08_05540, partial [Planctomycetes bacterium]|nr:hypothetical protein [Planctomycetota bacterium]